MFVNNTKNIEVNTRPKKAKKSSAKGDFSVFLKDEEEAQSSVNEVVATPSLNSALFLQEVDNDEDVKEKNYERGNDILDDLDNYQKDILKGQNNEQSLKKLSEQIKDERMKSADPMLESLIDEVELRAAVEAAKRGCK